MTDQTDTRPYTLRTVVIDGGDEFPIPAYSNHDGKVGEWPLFTREQIPALLEATVRSHLQLFWIDEIENYAVVTGYGNTLTDPFDLAPFMEAILRDEVIEQYDEGRGFHIARAGKHRITVDGEEFDTFDIDHVGYTFISALDATAAPRR